MCGGVRGGNEVEPVAVRSVECREVTGQQQMRGREHRTQWRGVQMVLLARLHDYGASRQALQQPSQRRGDAIHTALSDFSMQCFNGARIGRNCLVGAGSLVTEGKEFPDGSLIMGSPAKVVRELTPEQLEGLVRSAAAYVAKAQRFKTELVRLDGA